MKTIITNIKGLLQIREETCLKVCGADMAHLPMLTDAYLSLEHDKIAAWGKMDSCPTLADFDEVIDATGRFVLPAWIDSHTHLVYAQSREEEFVDRINGLSYEEIAQRGGGILNSVEKLRQSSEQELFQAAMKRIHHLIKQGTGAVEIKSGYGLDLASELKMLRVIKRLKQAAPIAIKATFLGAHAYPSELKNNPSQYIDLIINEMLPAITQEGLADYVDVFCESGYFSVEDTERILAAARQYGLQAKLHVNQFNSIGGVQAGLKYQALSLDHMEEMSSADLQDMKKGEAIPVALPGCSFFLGIPYTPAREIIDAGLPLALASDFNPGSTPSYNMNFVLSLACIRMKMNPEEAINAATINAAYAMGLSHEYGSICPGYKANLLITQAIPNYAYLPYAYGDMLIENVIINGKMYQD